MSVPTRFKDITYKNWLRCASSLLILKECLHDYTEAGVRRLHDNIKNSVMKQLGFQYQCNACSWREIRQQHPTGAWSIKCNNNICNVWLEEILTKHDDPQSKTINWGNADITKWSIEPWEIAKIYMTNGQRNKTDIPREHDIPALLSLLKYCKEFHPIDVQLVSDIIEISNKVLLSPDLRVSDLDKDTWIDKMLLLVSDLNIQGMIYTEINKLKDQMSTEDVDISIQDQEINVLQNLVLEVRKGDSDSLMKTKSQHKEEIDKIKGTARDNEAKIIGLQTQNQELETDLKGEKSQLQTYAQVISTLKIFIDDNPDLSKIKISEELRAAFSEIRALKTQLQTAESQLENIKDQEEIHICLDFEEADDKKEIQPVILSTDMQCLQKDLLHRYRCLNVIPISPFHESYTTDLDDIFTSVVVEKKDIDTLGNLQEQEQPRNSKEPIYLRSYHQLFGDKGNKRLILKGFMGSGKTVFCRKVVQTWCRVKTAQVDPESADERQVPPTNALDGEDILSQFEFLFFINLAMVNSQEDLLHAIHRQCSIPNDIEDKNFLCKLLQNMPEKILIILDGLHEMGSKTPDFVNDLLERYSQITVLVSTRPWQISKLNLQAHYHYDLLLDVQGFDEKSALDFATKVINAHDKDVSDSLIKDMIVSLTRKKIFATFRSVPLLLLFLIKVWCSLGSLPGQYSVLYSKIIDCMVTYYLNKTKGKNLNCIDMSNSKTKIMESSVFVKQFGNTFLELTSRLSYEVFLKAKHGTTVIISREELLRNLDEDEETAESKLGVLLDCGILSLSNAFSPLERNYSVSFINLSIQEFLAAVHLTLHEDVFQEFISSWTCLDDVLQNENLVTFTCGLAPHLGTLLFSRICEVCDHDSKVLEYRQESFVPYTCAINNLCSLYKICLNEVQALASLQLSDIQINESLTEEEINNFFYTIMILGVTSAVKSFTLSQSLSAACSASLCKIISNCTDLQTLHLDGITLHDGILDLSRLTALTSLNLSIVTMSCECSESLCRSICKCTHLQTLHLDAITLDDSILDLSRLTALTSLNLSIVTMSSECCDSLCRSISNCTHLQTLHLDGITLDDSILDLSRLTALTSLNLSIVTMSSECSDSLCRSISNCIHLQTLHLYIITLHDVILDLSRLTALTSLSLSNVTLSSECSEYLCRSIGNCTDLQTLHLDGFTLHDIILDLSRLTALTSLNLSNVNMSSECSESLCRSISNCTPLQTLHLYGITLYDSILDLSRMTALTSLNMSVVAMSSECSESLCRSISNCTQLQTLHLIGFTLHDSILDLSSLTTLTKLSLWNGTMSSECSDSLCRSISNCTHLQTLHLDSITLHDSILDLSRLTSLTEVRLYEVTKSSECGKSLCRSISNSTHLQTRSKWHCTT